MTRRDPHAVTAIRDRSTFQALRRPAGRGARGPVKVAYVPLPPTATGGASVRVGYSVGRGCGNAVQRNRLRRRFRAAVRTGNVVPGSYLLRADPAATELAYGPLVEAVMGAMAEAVRSADSRPEGLEGALR